MNKIRTSSVYKISKIIGLWNFLLKRLRTGIFRNRPRFYSCAHCVQE